MSLSAWRLQALTWLRSTLEANFGLIGPMARENNANDQWCMHLKRASIFRGEDITRMKPYSAAKRGMAFAPDCAH
jgi:hypothetical protein